MPNHIASRLSVLSTLRTSRPPVQVPVQISDLASRSDRSAFDIILRLSTLVLSATLFILSIAQVILSDYWWFFLPSSIYLVCQTGILALAHRSVNVPRPVTISLDLLLVLSAVVFILFSFPLGSGLYRECTDDDGSDTLCAAYWSSLRLAITSQIITGLIG